MTLEEFKRSINLRSIAKCCATCNHGFPDYCQGYRCYLPELAEVSDKRKKSHVFASGYYMETASNYVCDRWEDIKIC